MHLYKTKENTVLNFLFYGRMPSERAMALHAVKTCENFLSAGQPVRMFIPKHEKNTPENIPEHFYVKNKFPVKVAGSNAIFGRSPFFRWGAFSFSKEAASALRRGGGEDLWFSDTPISAIYQILACKKVFLEIHDLPRPNLISRWFLKRVLGIIVTTNLKREELISKFGVLPEKIFVVPNATDIESFNVKENTNEARQKLGLPAVKAGNLEDKKIIMYAGQLFDWKGADTLLETAKRYGLSTTNYKLLFVFVGGRDKDIQNLKEKAGLPASGLSNVIFTGQRPPKEIPLYLRASDVLVLPNTSRDIRSVRDTSPMKLFEYMAAQKPIVVSDLPSIREIVSENMVYFFKPDNPEDLSRKISDALNENSESKVRDSFKQVKEFSWDKRTKKILEFIYQNI